MNYVQGRFYRGVLTGFNEAFVIDPETREVTITEIVNKILEIKENNPNADVSKLEREIDQLVYKIYELNESEIAIIEGSIKN